MSIVPEQYVAASCCDKCGRPFEHPKAGIIVSLANLQYGENSIHVTNRESQLLQALLRTFPEPMHRERIFLSVYGMESDVQARTMDVIFCNLRKRMEKIGLTILCVYGVGFKLSLHNA